MQKKIKLYNIFLLLLILCCSCKETADSHNNKKDISKEGVSKLLDNCEIPHQVQDFLKKHTDEWSRISINDYNAELSKNLLESSKYNKPRCNYILKGDFNNNDLEDFAIILRNNKYSLNAYGNYKFPFLLIFNDYQKNLQPKVIYKTGAYKDDDIKTVIYSDTEYGILSYLEKNKICKKNIININYFEKSSFFVYWDEEQKEYQFLNHLDYPKEALCNIMNDINVASKEVENFSFYKDNENYFIKTFDLNGDKINDKIISSKPYMGDELIVFLGNKKGYTFSIKTINFSQDGGNIIKDITPTKNNIGFNLTTYFPDRGYYEEVYNIVFNNNIWTLETITYKISSSISEDKVTYICEVVQGINLNDPKLIDKIELIPEESERDKKCTVEKVN